MKKVFLLIWSLTFLTLPIMGQKRKVTQLTPEQQEWQAKQERMIANTQRIMIIDSMVVDKQQFLSYYRLTPEAGTIAHYQELFHTTQQPHAFVFVNEIGNRCYFSMEKTDSTVNLYSSDLMGNRWSSPKALRGINDDLGFRRVNYPFMMGDGTTLYFAAEGSDGLGGYDIYVTRYNAEENEFLHPANIGMPFNSEANDYMYAIDEYNNLGWFASDRNQPDDKVCIYIFIPPTTRQTYSPSEFSAEKIASFARIDRIADTWTDSLAYESAQQRLHALSTAKADSKTYTKFYFVINDNTTYTQSADFRAPGNAKRYQQLIALYNRHQRLQTTLDHARDYYATASKSERDELQPEILASEQKQHKVYQEIRQLEKIIRNQEIIFLTNKK